MAVRVAAARVPRLSGVAAVSGHGTLLPLPDDPRFDWLLQDAYTEIIANGVKWPRYNWLRMFEETLRPFYPAASSRDLSLTARHYAPFPLAAGHDVP